MTGAGKVDKGKHATARSRYARSGGRAAGYEPPAVVYEGEMETMAAICDSALAPGGNCRVSTIPNCIRITT